MIIHSNLDILNLKGVAKEFKISKICDIENYYILNILIRLFNVLAFKTFIEYPGA